MIFDNEEVVRFLAIASPLLGILLLAGCSSDSHSTAAPAKRRDPVRIVQFYASPGAVEQGDKILMCYGVENAAAVHLEPAVEQIQPAENRCVSIVPRHTATYRLEALGADGSRVSQTLSIQVVPRHAAARATTQPAAPEADGPIEAFAASSNEVSANQPVTLCYSVRAADSVRIEPQPGDMGADLRKCVSVTPSATTHYRLVVSAGGHLNDQTVTVRVVAQRN